MAVAIARRRFTIEDYHRMAEAGILTEDDRVELIDGEIVEMSPIGKHHAGVVNRLNALLHRFSAGEYMVAVQNPLQLSDDVEVQPDVTLLKARSDYYANQLPRPSDTILVIEVADTSLLVDREMKLPRYARAGIPEVWIVNLQEEVVEVYSEPAGSQYSQSRHAAVEDALALPSFPDSRLSVSDIFGLPAS